MYKILGKRLLDFGVSMVLFIVLLPVFFAVTFFLLYSNSGRPFFSQLRPGKNGKLFKIIKFKTMRDLRESDGSLLADDLRITAVGRLLRRSSLDEIPQLINVILGDMSLIGPRPLLPEYLALYNAFELKRHDVRPGITGWAQVNGRNAITWEEKFKLDVWYVENYSLSLDCKIAFLTFLKVIRREGISSATSATMEKFKGGKV